ncbi:hypothetical protein [Streptomyces minutiscleroticus]|uniref:hypothetical protein n=1 Tax=Streptomyces minutiscleroticus TaxID=68238 RepID=UPI00331BFE06
MSTPVRTSSHDLPLLTEYGLMEPALEMEFTAHFARSDGDLAAEAATAAVTRVIEAPGSFLAPVRDAGRSVSTCLLERSNAETCRIVLTADRAGITLAATDDIRVSMETAHETPAARLRVFAMVDGLKVHHGPDGHVWVVWRGSWRPEGAPEG